MEEFTFLFWDTNQKQQLLDGRVIPQLQSPNAIVPRYEVTFTHKNRPTYILTSSHVNTASELPGGGSKLLCQNGPFIDVDSVFTVFC